MLPTLAVDTQRDWTSSTLSGHLTQCAPETGEGTWGWSRVEVPQQLTLMNASIQSASKLICQIRVDTNQNVGPKGIQAAFGSVARPGLVISRPCGTLLTAAEPHDEPCITSDWCALLKVWHQAVVRMQSCYQTDSLIYATKLGLGERGPVLQPAVACNCHLLQTGKTLSATPTKL